MICRLGTAAFAVLVSLTVSCSEHDPAEQSGGGELAQKAAAQPARAPVVPAMCSQFSNVNQCPGVRHTVPLDCPKTNVLVRLPPRSACPERIPGKGGAWKGGAVFGELEGARQPGPRICSYYWTAPPSAAPDPTYFEKNVSETNWEWDCPRVAAHGDELNDALTAHGQYHVGEIEWSAVVSATARVAVIDTAASEWRDPDNNPHGKAVGILAQDAACNDFTSCNVRVEKFLGLPLIRDSESLPGQTIIRRDVARGGAFGAHGDLAGSIVRAVDAAPANLPTVINLSLAYDAPELAASTTPLPDDLSNGVVLDALRYARCRGALILAAAGNGPVPARDGQTAAFPARWTSLPALDTQACIDRYGIARHASNTAPLLYAVSGVDFGDRPLLTTRAEGQSVLAALGFAVVREDPTGGYTRILTGTSMATATVSGVAAAYWGTFLAAVSPDRIVRDLYEASPDVSSATPHFLPHQDPQSPKFFSAVRRINRCSIADTVRAPASCTVRPVSASNVPESVVPDLPEGAPSFEPSVLPERAGGVSPLEYPWILPQPEGEPGCTSCSLKLLDRRMELTLRSGFIARNDALRLLLRRAGVAGVASFAGGHFWEETVEPVADFVAQTVPFGVDLTDEELGTPTAAELSYEVEVDNVIVDMTESVLIEEEDGEL